MIDIYSNRAPWGLLHYDDKSQFYEHLNEKGQLEIWNGGCSWGLDKEPNIWRDGVVYRAVKKPKVEFRKFNMVDVERGTVFHQVSIKFLDGIPQWETGCNG